MDKEVTDLPEPDSPTIATTSPQFTVKEIFFSAFVIPDSAMKSTERLFIRRRGCIISPPL
jgi:hypothetical protein